MKAHDRFEALAGAVMLGEATPEERATFDAHAAICDRCRTDARDGAYVTSQLQQASRSERWLPSQPISERLRARRSARSRVTLGALGWSVALSLVLNVAFVSGVGARLGSAFLSTAAPDSDVASTRITLEAARPKHVAFAPAPPSANGRHLLRRAAMRRPHRGTAPVVSSHDARAGAHDSVPVDVPDLLAGIDLYGDGAAHRTVAAVPIPRCIAHDDERAAVRPCRDGAGRLER